MFSNMLKTILRAQTIAFLIFSVFFACFGNDFSSIVFINERFRDFFANFILMKMLVMSSCFQNVSKQFKICKSLHLSFFCVFVFWQCFSITFSSMSVIETFLKISTLSKTLVTSLCFQTC